MTSMDPQIRPPEGRDAHESANASDEKRDRILRAALEVCAQKGVAAARMEEIAARAEVSKGTLYRYFESKEDLLLATILASYVQSQRHVDAEKEAATDPREALALLCNGLTDVLMEVSAEVRGSYFADHGWTNPDLVPGADLAGTDLRGHRLCGADLRNALLIGADLRGCDLAGADLLGADLRGARVEDADLSLALYVTGPQLAAAHGNRRTRVPTGMPVPRSWSSE